MSNLDTMFNHYVVALQRQALLEQGNTGWRATVPEFAVFVGKETTPEEIAQALSDQLTAKVFTRMRQGQVLPIVDGINLNGGSC